MARRSWAVSNAPFVGHCPASLLGWHWPPSAWLVPLLMSRKLPSIFLPVFVCLQTRLKTLWAQAMPHDFTSMLACVCDRSRAFWAEWFYKCHVWWHFQPKCFSGAAARAEELNSSGKKERKKERSCSRKGILNPWRTTVVLNCCHCYLKKKKKKNFNGQLFSFFGFALLWLWYNQNFTMHPNLSKFWI